MEQTNKIKAKVGILIRNGDSLLVHNVLSSEKEREIIRPPGGHIEYGEFSKDAVEREMKEEINARLTNLILLGSLENIFNDPEGKTHHEIIFVYSAEFEDKRFYEKEVIEAKEIDGSNFNMFWIKTNDILTGTAKFVPRGMENFVKMLS